MSSFVIIMREDIDTELFDVRYSLKRRLIIIGVTFLLLLGLAALTMNRTAEKYRFYAERSALAQQIYASYRAVSDHTYRKLNALGRIVEQGSLINIEERYRNKEALRDALRDVRENIAAELSHVGDASEASELEHFNKIELLAEEIIRGSELVRVAVETNQPAAAVAALRQIRENDVEREFIRLIDEAIFEELREVGESQRVAQELNQLLTRLLSIIALCVVVLCALLLWSVWRALTHNLKVFEDATSEYLASNFSYRVSDNVADEFSPLATALNTMSSEVEQQRQREATTQENLEALVATRTNELQNTNAKLQEISETRKQFLADISHELRTPLTIIQGEADLALRSSVNLSEPYHAAMVRIKEQTTHTSRFIQDLLFVARANDGKAPIHKRPVSIVGLVSDCRKDFAMIANERGIKILQNHSDEEFVVHADDSKLKQAITILLDNAIRYSYDNSIVEIKIDRNSDNVVVEVIDSGIGLKYNEASQVFSRFYRGAEGSGKASGTGLGLPVAKAIIEAHGGIISLEGEETNGTAAIITLPLAAQLQGVS